MELVTYCVYEHCLLIKTFFKNERRFSARWIEGRDRRVFVTAGRSRPCLLDYRSQREMWIEVKGAIAIPLRPLFLSEPTESVLAKLVLCGLIGEMTYDRKILICPEKSTT